MHLPSLIQFLLSTALITIPHPLFPCSLVPSHYPRIAFDVLVFFTVSTTTFCSQVCHMVSLVVVLSVNVIHMVALCCTCDATPFFSTTNALSSGFLLSCLCTSSPLEGSVQQSVGDLAVSARSHSGTRLFCQAGQLPSVQFFFAVSALTCSQTINLCATECLAFTQANVKKSIMSILLVHPFLLSVHSWSPAHSDANLSQTPPLLCHPHS